MGLTDVKRNIAGLPSGLVVLLMLSLLAGREVIAEKLPPFEQPPVFSASQIVPKELLSGPNHKVQEQVVNDGLMNHYVIDSPFGTFEASSNAALRIRVREINAIAKLKEVSRSEQFIEGVGTAGQKVLSGAGGLVTDPYGSLKGAATGVAGLFKTAAGAVKGDSDSGSAKDWIGYSKARREYAIAFGVDPYSANEVLQAELSRVSQAGYAGDMSASVATAFVSGGAGIAVSS